jgi:hypothetical protein
VGENMKQIVAHSHTINKLINQARAERLTSESCSLSSYFSGYDIIINNSMLINGSFPKKQDKRKNKRIQARKVIREKRAKKIPDPDFYIVDSYSYLNQGIKKWLG